MPLTDIRRDFPAGFDICVEGAPGDCAYIIEQGELEIWIQRGDEKIVLARRGPGEIFGEMAIVDAQPRSATVTTLTPCRLLVLSEAQLQKRLRHLDPVLRMVLSVTLERLRETLRRMRADSAPTGVAPQQGEAACAEPERVAGFEAAIARIEIEQELRHAIAQDQLELFYQPIIRSADGAPAGFEALARWRHPERGLLPPGVFIGVAEESGLIREISRWAVLEACRGGATLRAAAAQDPGRFVSVNITADDIADPQFFDHVGFALEAAALPPAALMLEITESTFVEQADQTLRMLERYRELGVRVAIDDFGAGYSNFAYIARYPVQKLKIDKSIVDEIAHDPRNVTLIQVITEMAKVLGMSLVAEGVETAEQAAQLRDLGCDYLQGYHFARPAPLQQMLELRRRA